MGKKKRKKLAAAERQPMLFWVIMILAGLSLAVPLMTALHENLTPFYSKWLAFQVLTELMFGCWVLLAVARPEFRPDWRNPITVGLFAIIAGMLLTLPFAVDPAYSFWSRPARMTGVVNYLHYFGWLFVLSSAVKSAPIARRLMGFSCLVALGVGLFGLGTWLDKPGKTVYATLDNPSFFGAYMMMHVFVALYLLSISQRWGWRLFYGATLLISLVAVPLSGSRGALLVTVVGLTLLAFGLMIVSTLRRRNKIILTGAVIGALILLLVSISWLRTSAGRVTGTKILPAGVQRIVYKDFGSDRWQLWSYALEGGMQKPLFGWGGEQYELMFYENYDPAGGDREVLNERFADRAHNQYLDTFVASGAVGLLGYLVFLGSLFFVAWQSARRASTASDRRTSVFIGVAGAAHAAYSFFMFDTPAALTVLLLWFVLAAVHYRSVSGVVPEGGKARPNLVRWLVVPVLAAAVALMLLCNILPARKWSQMMDARAEISQSRTRAAAMFEAAFSGYHPYRQDARLRSFDEIQVYAENVSLVSSSMETLLRFMANQYAEAAEVRSYNVRYQLVAAAIHRMLGVYDSTALAKADRYAQAALAASPNRFGPYVELAEINLLRDEADQAVKNFELAAERVPQLNRSHQAYMQYRLACAYAQKCDATAAQEAFSEATRLNHPNSKDSRLVLTVGRYCSDDQAFAWLLPHIDELLLVYPDHPQILRAAAKIYMTNGATAQAADMLERLRRRDREAADSLAEELGFTLTNQ